MIFLEIPTILLENQSFPARAENNGKRNVLARYFSEFPGKSLNFIISGRISLKH